MTDPRDSSRGAGGWLVLGFLLAVFGGGALLVHFEQTLSNQPCEAAHSARDCAGPTCNGECIEAAIARQVD